MEFEKRDAPFVAPTTNVASMMLHVLYALIPAALAYVWYFGSGFVFNLIIAGIFCIAGESLMLRLRGRPVEATLADYSVLVTAALLTFAMPALTPWWVTATAALFATVVAKHLYGGLGYNLFNPAMVGYVVVLIAFPMDMNLWTAPRMGDIDYQFMTIAQTARFTLTGSLPDYLTFDAISRATPLDIVKAGLNDMRTFEELRAYPMMGDFGGRGWEWIGNFTAIGGAWLLVKKIIRWQIPFGVLMGLLIPSSLMYFLVPGVHPSPGFHLFSGGTILCAFFIATDPVSAATSEKGRLIYGFGIGFLIYAIREWGSYADGVAFAVLLMNLAVPTIDYLTKPHIVGHPIKRRGAR
ncbi:MAG: RnfABCDGE type electron transport complex subunit D [Proteobacteria bacterium]|nr:RnfABCDGE type electron transport complex subunit D [Pseudomonadota bacterium]MDA0992925.1 RnfABCDGE type electron transport complex subunit D [Pseudomonadota bacterium]